MKSTPVGEQPAKIAVAARLPSHQLVREAMREPDGYTSLGLITKLCRPASQKLDLMRDNIANAIGCDGWGDERF